MLPVAASTMTTTAGEVAAMIVNGVPRAAVPSTSTNTFSISTDAGASAVPVLLVTVTVQDLRSSDSEHVGLLVVAFVAATVVAVEKTTLAVSMVNVTVPASVPGLAVAVPVLFHSLRKTSATR